MIFVPGGTSPATTWLNVTDVFDTELTTVPFWMFRPLTDMFWLTPVVDTNGNTLPEGVSALVARSIELAGPPAATAKNFCT